MAKIVLKGRREPIEIDNERAQKIKNRWLGINGEEKASPIDVFDLGTISGEYGRLAEIEIVAEQKKEDAVDRRAEAEAKAKAEWKKLTPKQKASRTSRFILKWRVRTGKYKDLPPSKVLAELERIQEKYFTENPEEMAVPNELVEKLLPVKAAQSLAEQMDINPETQKNGLKCLTCHKELSGAVMKYCSGECMLKAKNG